MDRPLLIVTSKKDEKLINSIKEGFESKLNTKLNFEIVESVQITGGFIAVIDGKVYDASFSSRLHELGRQIIIPEEKKSTVESSFSAVGALLKQRIKSSDADPLVYDYGVVKSYSDDIVHIAGLSGCHYGELLSFDGGATGLALDLVLGGVGAALLGGSVSTTSLVHTTGRIAEICVGDELLGRVVDPLGQPIDGKELIASKFRPIEAHSPTIMQRSPVNTPLETGILAIDSMIPIGRGQRELIIGDRQTGKTSIALSTIMNQKNTGVVCVYCAIGQKTSTVSNLVHILKTSGALEHTVVVAAMAHDTAAMQYIAPYAACAVAEEIMYSGKDVLIVYDDLSKHAVAYRTLSLLLRRPSGREAYPGDVFYLHSRLLERAAKLSPELGGGSMTALPIVETMAGDISAYIPTNVISITDGQIYLETTMFNAGQRPAVNVGLSVSRVGRAAQRKAMRSVSGTLRLEIAQYRDMAVFAQFGADIDAATASLLRRGERLERLMVQPAELGYSLAEQVVLLLAESEGVYDKFETNEVNNLTIKLLDFIKQKAEKILTEINTSLELSDTNKKELKKLYSKFLTEVTINAETE
ncbi:MAG: F0F1 ATP synthase subunit alpha [Oscillospiraceae bacterium]|jgi:F-type H+-transporting ATPase subunit alpha|nr:F0F1 ATP synthase subunit alpha [Oscillospiraceae bacterium]